MKTWNFCTSIIAGIVYFIIAEDKTSIIAFIAIMSYLFYIDNKMDKEDNYSMKSLIKKFTSRQCERYILNNMYREDAELINFVQERNRTLGKSSIPFVITWDDFPADQYGKVELVWNNKIVESAKLMRNKHNLIYWKFDE